MNTSDLNHATVAQLSSMLSAGKISSVELAQYFIARIKSYDGGLNSVITLCEEQAMASAVAADIRRTNGDETDLTGIPLLHKDIFCTRGIKTSLWIQNAR